MSRLLATALACATAGCALLPVPEGGASGPAQPSVSTARAVHLARVRCLLLAPFENASDDPLAAEAATAAFASAIDANRTRVYPIAELRSLFKDTSLELPEGVSPSLALELAELIGADAALYGAIEGRSRGADPTLTVTIRLAAAGARDLLFARVVEVQPKPDEATADLIRRVVLAESAPLLERLGVPGRKVCFDRQRTDRLRFMALAGEQRATYPAGPPVTAALPPAPLAAVPLPPAPEGATPRSEPGTPPSSLPPPPAPEPPPQTAEIGDVEILAALPRTPRSSQVVKVESAADLPEPVVPVVEAKPPQPEPLADAAPENASKAGKGARAERKKVAVAAVIPAPPARPAAAPRTLTVRQADWATRLQKGGRVLVDDIAFASRSGQLGRDAGLRDLVALLAVAPNLKVRIEGFVDATSDADGDLRVSMEMARAVGRRLIELGVARDRVSWAGRGGDAPILPNFTARGRTANRRIEVLAAE